MRFVFAIFALLLPALRLPAGTVDPIPVDVSDATTEWLNPRDALLFTVSEWSYEVNAPERGLSPYPSQATFQFVTEPQNGSGDFTAVLESPDGSVSVDFPGTFSWHAGYTQSSGYTGPVSVLYGSMDLSATLSEELFASSSAVLILENQGGSVDVGLPPYSLDQDLGMSFSTGGYGVGGPVVAARYQDPPAAPEPNSGRLLLVLGALLWAATKGRSRWSRHRIE